MSIKAKYGITDQTEVLGEGVEATIYALDDKRVIRIHKSKDNSLENRVRVLRDVYDSLDRSAVSFDVPTILSIDVDEGIVSTVDKRLHGQAFSSIYASMDDASKRVALSSYMDCAAQIQNLQPAYPYYGEIISDNPIRDLSWKGFLSKKLNAVYERGRETIRQDVPDVAIVLDFMLNQLSLFDDVNESRLVHGDYYVSNVLVDQQKVSAVLDFNELMLAGDPRMDIASAIIFLGDHGDGSRNNERAFLISELEVKYGDKIKEIIHFYKLYYAFIFGALTKDNDTSTYRWSINVLKEQLQGEQSY